MNDITCRSDCVLTLYARGHLRANCRESRIIEKPTDCGGCGLDGVPAPGKVKTGSQSLDSTRVVGLVLAMGHD